jgi:hypothetical protein
MKEVLSPHDLLDQLNVKSNSHYKIHYVILKND